MLEKIKNDLKIALKSKDLIKVSTLRFLLAELKNEEIKNGKALANEQILKIIQRQIKKRKESIKLYRQGNREDLASKETQEIEVLQAYLPPQLSRKELDQIIKKGIERVQAREKKDTGKVMGAISPLIEGRADKSEVSRIIVELLSS